MVTYQIYEANDGHIRIVNTFTRNIVTGKIQWNYGESKHYWDCDCFHGGTIGENYPERTLVNV